MARFEGGNNPNNDAHVDSRGRIEAHAISITEQASAAIDGDSYNFNTSNLVLTTDVDTPLFFIKNDNESRDMIVTRVFVTFAASTVGTGDIEGTIIYNPTGGTVLTNTAKAPENFNAGSSKTLLATATLGGTGITVTGGTTPIEFLFPSDSSRHLVGFESIVLPRGGSFVFTVTPPTGNTSIKIQAGCNIFLSQATKTNANG